MDVLIIYFVRRSGDMKIVEKEEDMPIFQTPDKDGYVEHIICEGSRKHVLYWDSHGEHCTVTNCEINKPREKDCKINKSKN